jgi:hypothetical protein
MLYYITESVLMRFQPFYTLKDVFEKLVSNVCIFQDTLRQICKHLRQSTLTCTVILINTFWPSKSIVLMSYYTSEPVLMQFLPSYILKDVFEKLVSNVCVFLGTLRPKCKHFNNSSFEQDRTTKFLRDTPNMITNRSRPFSARLGRFQKNVHSRSFSSLQELGL